MIALLCSVASACTRPARPTITGAELYARVQVLQHTGQATVGKVTVRKGQALTTDEQSFLVDQVIDKCRGGDAGSDVECALALLLDQRFTVVDRLPQPRTVKPDREDQTGSAITSVVVVGLALAAAGGLVYGVATCEFPGCKAVFGVPLVLIGGGLLFVLVGD